ncbi:MAG TPA: thioesterase family protein [Candidatus Polarisedimenticolaceae bacterium]|nr:thioesterase family protein [Candidatus Polarisedimenticolaceae bacterium]
MAPAAPERSQAVLREGQTKTRVRYPETDRMGIAHHTHYFTWFELGRTELMRQLGCTYGDLEEQSGIFFPVVEASADFLASARYDEVVTITTRLVRARGVRVRFTYVITREDGTVLATGHTEHASVDGKGKPQRLPGALQRRLAGQEKDA